MKRKKASKKKKASSPPSLSESEHRLVAELAGKINDADPAGIVDSIPHAHAALALVDMLSLDHPSTPTLLAQIKDRFSEKRVHKAIKRVLFKLKGKGVRVEDVYGREDTVPVSLKPSKIEGPRAYVGTLDGMGYRPVMMLLTPSTGGQEIGLGAVSDEKGIQEFLFAKMSKKRARELRRQFSTESGTMVETSLNHFASVLDRAYQASLVLGSEVPGDYLELRSRIKAQVTPLERPAIYDLVGGDAFHDDRPLTDTEIDALLDHPFMKSWVLELEPMRPFMEEIVASEDSPLILSPEQKTRRMAEIKERCAAALFPGEKRQLMKNRLEEMAFVFQKLDESSDYPVSCLKAALAMDETDSAFKKNLFLYRMVDRSMTVYFTYADEKGSQEDAQETNNASPILMP
ncbi:MAG: hypothetical protein P8165_00870 [Deltaproteobacteria bacterium]